jgi:hypothetical protein
MPIIPTAKAGRTPGDTPEILHVSLHPLAEAGWSPRFPVLSGAACSADVALDGALSVLEWRGYNHFKPDGRGNSSPHPLHQLGLPIRGLTQTSRQTRLCVHF